MTTDPTPTGLGPGRAFALVVAAVAASVAASLILVGNGADPAPAEAPAAAAGSDVVQAAPAAATAPAGDVTPDLVPKADLPLAPADEVHVATAPDMPPPIERTEPAIVDVGFEVVENVSTIDLAKGTQFETWGYRVVDGPDGVVTGTPGPVIRARVGDVLRLTVTNPADNTMPHNIDFHAVTGQGGGAAALTVKPGESATIEARLLYPGFFLYHCAAGDVPAHISHGMYGGVLVQPETPMPDVDHEWYMVQSEYYLTEDGGVAQLDRKAVTDENPTLVVFNGAVGALTGDNALQMNVGERSRIYLANAGLNLTSNFHPIGSHWDRVWEDGALLNPALRGVQTTLVPAGGATVVDIVGQVPQTVLLVDHALARTFDKGALGQIVISGDENPEIFEQVEPGPVAARPEQPAASETPTADAAAATGDSYDVDILAGAGTFQDLDSPDEFSDSEDPADYSVNVLEVKVGDTVTWTNQDAAMMHSVTAADGSFDSGLLAQGETFSHTFTDPGEFEYFCTPHPWMRAKVVVTE